MLCRGLWVLGPFKACSAASAVESVASIKSRRARPHIVTVFHNFFSSATPGRSAPTSDRPRVFTIQSSHRAHALASEAAVSNLHATGCQSNVISESTAQNRGRPISKTFRYSVPRASYLTNRNGTRSWFSGSANALLNISGKLADSRKYVAITGGTGSVFLSSAFLHQSRAMNANWHCTGVQDIPPGDVSRLNVPRDAPTVNAGICEIQHHGVVPRVGSGADLLFNGSVHERSAKRLFMTSQCKSLRLTEGRLMQEAGQLRPARVFVHNSYLNRYSISSSVVPGGAVGVVLRREAAYVPEAHIKYFQGGTTIPPSRRPMHAGVTMLPLWLRGSKRKQGKHDAAHIVTQAG